MAVLNTYLTPLQKVGQITIWSDLNLKEGADWGKELRQHLESAAIILLLISPDFLASDFCYDTEMRRAIERHEQGSARTIPILLRPVHWHDMPFAKLQVLPSNALPITKWSDRDDAFHDSIGSIHRVIAECQTR
jgi:hypothetical protein